MFPAPSEVGFPPEAPADRCRPRPVPAGEPAYPRGGEPRRDDRGYLPVCRPSAETGTAGRGPPGGPPPPPPRGGARGGGGGRPPPPRPPRGPPPPRARRGPPAWPP